MPTGTRISSRTKEDSQKLIRRRYAAERRFRAYGIMAILFGLAFLVGAPVLGGGATGYVAGKMRNASEREGVDETRASSLVAAYRRRAEEARMKAKLRQLQEQNPGGLVQVSG